jgi:Segregation and condensation protein ScpA
MPETALSHSAYTVQLPVFEGPLDLLLHLIERAELDITRVALAQVTDQFLGYLAAMQERHMDEVVSFLVIAARLLQIKSEALLPRPPQREAGEEDPGEELARQLRLYKAFKKSAEFLQQRESLGLRSYLRLAPPPRVRRRWSSRVPHWLSRSTSWSAHPWSRFVNRSGALPMPFAARARRPSTGSFAVFKLAWRSSSLSWPCWSWSNDAKLSRANSSCSARLNWCPPKHGTTTRISTLSLASSRSLGAASSLSRPSWSSHAFR